MKRLGLITTLFCMAFLFTQCKDSCGWGSGPGTEPSPIGFSVSESTFAGDSLYPQIEIKLDYAFTMNKSTLSIISLAYACDLVPGDFSLARLVDSIQVLSNPSFNLHHLEQQLLIENNSGRTVKLSDFNNFITRNNISNASGDYALQLNAKPTQSDSFTFSFYYYKDGAIIDSSFTQKYYISNE